MPGAHAEMNFSAALELLKKGKRVSRKGWNGKGMWLYLERHMDGFKPFIVMNTVDNEFVPWLASQTDILACDWTAVVS